MSRERPVITTSFKNDVEDTITVGAAAYDNPWDPSEEKKKEMFEKEGVVWDPGALAWREPRPGEIPPPDDFPEEPTPYQKDRPRDTVPPRCLGFYDRYIKAQAGFRELSQRVKSNEKAYVKAQTEFAKQWMKAMILLSWDIGSSVGAAADALGAGRHVIRGGLGRGGRTGLRTNMPPGKIRQALGAARKRVSDLTSKVAKLTREAAQAAKKAAKKSGVVKGLKRALDRAKDQVTNLRNAIRLGDKFADQLATAKNAAKEVAEKIEGMETRLDALRRAEPIWDELDRAEEALRNAKKLANQHVRGHDAAARRFLREMKSELPRIQREVEARLDQQLINLRRQAAPLEDAMDDAKRSGNRELLKQLEAQQEQLQNAVRALERKKRQVPELLQNMSRVYDDLGIDPGKMDVASLLDRAAIEACPELTELSSYQQLRSADDAYRAAQQAVEQSSQAHARASAAYQRVGHLDPREIPMVMSELDNARAESTRAARRIKELESYGALSPAELAEKKRALDVAERNVARTERRLAEAQRLADEADRLQTAKAIEAQNAADELKIANSQLDDLELHEGRPASGSDVPPSRIPQGATPEQHTFDLALRELGRLMGQSGEEMGKILSELRQAVTDRLAAFQAAQAEYDSLMSDMRTTKQQLDKCLEMNTPIE